MGERATTCGPGEEAAGGLPSQEHSFVHEASAITVDVSNGLLNSLSLSSIYRNIMKAKSTSYSEEPGRPDINLDASEVTAHVN